MSLLPYKITMYLKTPVAFQTGKTIRPLHFDGILAAIMLDQDGKYDFESINDIQIPELPLEKYGPVYRASAMEIDRSKSKTVRETWTGNMSWLDYAYIPRAIPPGSGIYRTKAGLLHLLVTPYINFYFSGDIDKIYSLLNSLNSVGGRRAAGYGEIKDMDIYKIKKDYSIIDGQGYPSRHIPVDLMGEHNTWIKDYVGYVPPYWYYPNYSMCYVPPAWRYWPVKSYDDVKNKIEEALNRKKEKENVYNPE